MKFERLRQEVWLANKALVEAGLVVLTWGNASAVDRRAGVVAIKPSGVRYEDLKPEDIVILSVETGQVVDGGLRPSSDCPAHLVLYEGFESIGGVVHTHSEFATSWAQARREIPCLGTTHADRFFGPVPLVRQLTAEEVENDYERNAGRAIVEHFAEEGLDPSEMPAALAPGHGPFVWGLDAATAVANAVTLEATARMAFRTVTLNPGISSIPQALLNKHFLRKHGPDAYYGQKP